MCLLLTSDSKFCLYACRILDIVHGLGTVVSERPFFIATSSTLFQRALTWSTIVVVGRTAAKGWPVRDVIIFRFVSHLPRILDLLILCAKLAMCGSKGVARRHTVPLMNGAGLARSCRPEHVLQSAGART